MESSTLNTFWRILQYSNVSIPTIQRDYTYGRGDARPIMLKMVGSIVDALFSNNPLHLDFVYGKLIGKENQQLAKKNQVIISELLKSISAYASSFNLDIDFDVVLRKEVANSFVTLVPLDGQQRLTTLFLVHWYIAQCRHDEMSLPILRRFSYATRTSSREFCKMICENIFDFKELDSGTSASELVKNNEHFFSFWYKDPTVNSMLIVMDEIHRSISRKGIDFDRCWQSLTEIDLIRFDFLDLDDFELTDELYIKMNARGRELSAFENFKAWLVKEISPSDTNAPNDWSVKLDVTWNDLFWSEKPKGMENIDAPYLQYFKDQFLSDFIKSSEYTSGGANDEETENIGDSLRDYTADATKILESSAIFRSSVSAYLHLLDKLCLARFGNTEKVLKNYWDDSVKKLFFRYDPKAEFTWWNHTLQYAVGQYLLKAGGNQIYFGQWLRIISNLIFNTTIDNPRLYRSAILSIDNLLNRLEGSTGVNALFSQINANDISFFAEVQKKEEIIKAELIVNDPAWEEVLIEAEQHPYFYGQVLFLLQLSKSQGSTSFDIDSFRDLYKRVALLFSDEVLDAPDHLLFRVFLSFGDCFHKNGNHWTFSGSQYGTVRLRNENWRRFFSDETLRPYILKVISHHLFDSNDLVRSLKNIIDAESSKLSVPHLTRFVNNPALLNYAQRRSIRTFDQGYYILSSSRISGYFVELNTYDWFLSSRQSFENANPAIRVEYNYVRGESNEPGIILISANRTQHIRFDSTDGKFFLENDKVTSIEDALEKYKLMADSN